MKTYILQKDLPDYKAGEKFSSSEGDLYISDTPSEDGTHGQWPKRYVENNPEWFLKEPEEAMSVTGIGNRGVLSAHINADWLAATIVQHIYIFLKNDSHMPSFQKVKEWVLENVPEAK